MSVNDIPGALQDAASNPEHALDALQSHAPADAGQAADRVRNLGDAAQQQSERLGDQAQHLGDQAQRQGEQLGQQAQRQAEQLGDRAGEQLGRVGDRLGQQAGQLTDQAQQQAGRLLDRAEGAAGRAEDLLDQGADRASNLLDRGTDRAGDAAERAGERVEQAADRAGQRAEQTAERVEQAAEHAAERVEQAAEHAAERVEQAAEHAVERAEQAAERVGERVEQAAAAAEAAAGRAADRVEQVAENATAAAGAMASQVERTADEIVQRAQGIAEQVERSANGLVERVENVANQLRATGERLIAQAEGAAEQVQAQARAMAQRLEATADRLVGQAQALVHRLEGTAERIAGQVSGFADQIEGAADRMTERLGGLIDSLDEKARQLVSQAATLGDKLTEYVSALGDEVSGLVTQVEGAVTNVMNRGRELVAQAEGAVNRVIEQGRALIGQVEGAVDRAAAQGRALIAQAQAAVDHAVEQAQQLLSQAEAAVDRAVGQLSNVVDAVGQTADRIVGEISGLASKCQNTIDQIVAKVDQALDEAKGLVADASNQVGRAVTQTQEAIQNVLAEARRRGEDVAQKLGDALRPALELFDRAKQLLPGLPDGVLGAAAFTFRSETDGGTEWQVLRVHGVEELSQLYEYELVLMTAQTDAEVQQLLDGPAVFTVERPDAARTFCGIVRQVEHLGWVPAGGTVRNNHLLVRVVLAPKLWRLSQRVNSRIFQQQNVVAIVRAVLEDAGVYNTATTFDASLLHRDQHLVREYCVQYRESDLAFVMRLLEEEGIAFHFEHDEGEGEKLILSDGFQFAFEWLPTPDGSDEIPLLPERNEVAAVESVRRFAWAEQLRPTGVILRDYDFTRPGALPGAMTAAAPRRAAGTERAVFDYPGRFVMQYDAASDAHTSHSGERLAKARQREQQATRRVCTGESNVSALAPGFRFKLREERQVDAPPRPAAYLLQRVEHFGSAPELVPGFDLAAELGGVARRERYVNEFRCIPLPAKGTFYFHPARTTPRPSVQGPQTATVVGPAGQEIHTDAHGRIKVQFHWDREGLHTDASSCWVRVAQAWAGDHFGAMFVPRVGMEVVVTFLEGDPDRPLVVGCVYNGDNPPPYRLPDEMTRSTLKTRSTPNGEGSNELRFEDATGAEELYLHAARDHNTVVEHDQGTLVKRNMHTTVEHTETHVVNQKRTTTVTSLDRLEVNGTRETVVNGNAKLVVNKTEKLKGDQSIEVAHNRETWVGNDEKIIVVANRDTAINNNETVVVTNDRHTTVGHTETLTVTSRVTIQCGGSTIVVTPSGVTISSGGTVTVKGSTVALNP